MTDVTLHLFAGKIASGKSTLAAELSRRSDAVVISEDEWLSALFGEEMSDIDDYIRCSQKLKRAMEPHVLSLLSSGVSIVLDFPANTVAQRRWMRDLIDQAGCAHELHFLDAPDDVCKERLRIRNRENAHAFQVTDEQFDMVTSHFVPPSPGEGFNVIRYENGKPVPPA